MKVFRIILTALLGAVIVSLAHSGPNPIADTSGTIYAVPGLPPGKTDKDLRVVPGSVKTAFVTGPEGPVKTYLNFPKDSNGLPKREVSLGMMKPKENTLFLYSGQEKLTGGKDYSYDPSNNTISITNPALLTDKSALKIEMVWKR